ncbi:MAG: aminotransferase class V-fold PLP-dependent enzyme [Crocinitomicaceae bacterium]|nr:aminotransferase class V-fold PLP-dependent enzyme [Crocinitomicaceae bacterium]
MEKNSQSLVSRIYKAQYSCNYQLPGPFGNRYITYADYIASGQPLRFIEEYIQSTILPTYANTHTESSFTGLQTSRYREEAKDIIRNAVNANEDDAILFRGSGCTGAIDLMVRKLLQFYDTQESYPVVFIGPYEHHSNILPWREGPFELIEIPMGKKGNVDLVVLEEGLKKYAGKRPMIGSFSAASNVTGLQAPVEEITALIKKYDALSFWDYAGAAPYVPIDMNPMDAPAIDAIFISPHKLIGGPGTPGLLIVKKSIFNEGLPVVVGGGTVQFVTKSQQHYFEDIETREDGGTPAIIESIRAAMAFKLKSEVGPELIEELEKIYITEAINIFKTDKNIYILGSKELPRLGFFSFHVKHENKFLHHNFVVALLNDLFGIQSRGGCSCAGPYGHDLLDITEDLSQQHTCDLMDGNNGNKPGWVRLSFNYFIPKEEFDFIVRAIEWIGEHGWKLLKSYLFNDRNGLWSHKNANDESINSLSNFIHESPALLVGDDADREICRSTYFVEATKIVKEALNSWGDTELQQYHFDLLNHPLRWYSLADDVK